MIKPGVWQHTGNKHFYCVLFVGRHTESNEELVAYVPMYCHEAGGLVPQFRPAKMWEEMVVPLGAGTGPQPRFIFIGDKLPPKAEYPEYGKRRGQIIFIQPGQMGQLSHDILDQNFRVIFQQVGPEALQLHIDEMRKSGCRVARLDAETNGSRTYI